MKRYHVTQLEIPPESRHEGVEFVSTNLEILDALLEEVERVSPSKLKRFTVAPSSIPDIVIGTFKFLNNKDTSIGFLITKYLSSNGWKIVSSNVEDGYTHYTFRCEYEND